VAPLVALTVLPFLFHLLSLTSWPARVAIRLFAAAAGREVALVWRQQSPLDNEMAPFEQTWRRTAPDQSNDLVMDGKGKRFSGIANYWVLEGVTLRRIDLG